MHGAIVVYRVRRGELINVVSHFDDETPGASPEPSTNMPNLPVATFAPIRGANGDLVPAFAAMGTF